MPIRAALLLFLMAVCATQPTACSTPPPRVDDSQTSRSADAPASGESLAECLTRKGVRLYGASWCRHCHDQLALFGDQVSSVPYTDCQPKGTFGNIPECEALGIDAFPTWIFPDGRRAVGVRSLKWLATTTDCPLR